MVMAVILVILTKIIWTNFHSPIRRISPVVSEEMFEYVDNEPAYTINSLMSLGSDELLNRL